MTYAKTITWISAGFFVTALFTIANEFFSISEYYQIALCELIMGNTDVYIIYFMFSMYSYALIGYVYALLLFTGFENCRRKDFTQFGIFACLWLVLFLILLYMLIDDINNKFYAEMPYWQMSYQVYKLMKYLCTHIEQYVMVFIIITIIHYI
jgi:hypothetical protein